MADSMTFGYVRVSSKDQNEARQVEQMKQFGIADRNIFIEKESGKDFDREQYKAIMAMLREGDTLVVVSIDRLGRNYSEILAQWAHITKEIKANIVVLDMPLLDTRNNKDLTGTLISDIVLQLLSYVAQKERENIKARQAEGIALAKKAGAYRGRQPKNIDMKKFEDLYSQTRRGEITNNYAMRQMAMTRNMYYRLIKEMETKTGRWAE